MAELPRNSPEYTIGDGYVLRIFGGASLYQELYLHWSIKIHYIP